MIAVLIPTDYEARWFFNCLEDKAPLRLGGLRGYQGRIQTKVVLGCVIRVGMPKAVESAQQLIEAFEVERLLLAGFAGGLDPSLKRGDCLKVSAESIPQTIETVERVVATISAKRVLWEQTGSRIVDMEAAPVAAVAAAYQIPFSVLRVVSDAADEALPAELLNYGYNQEKGRETPIRMGFRLATHPRELFVLQRFLKRVGPCRRILADALVTEITQTS